MSSSKRRPSPSDSHDDQSVYLPSYNINAGITTPREDHVSILVNEYDQKSISYSHTSLIRNNEEDYRHAHKSKWLDVHNNLQHIICLNAVSNQVPTQKIFDFFLALKIKKELKRAQDEIKITGDNFVAIRRFSLSTRKHKMISYDTTYVKPNDAVICDQWSDEPLSIQSILYYFNQKDITYGSIYWIFLNNIIQVTEVNRKRLTRRAQLQCMASVLVSIAFSTLGLMFFIMTVSVISTLSKFQR
ncbi:unnamed protein product [Didymodactylos carnosus]|uniref:Uncharacterized protein n=1 Tax=Didymodactylos carnosus TaxID=1234261 RepID=A0A8S2DVJ6_9BILA|nr:unnamed protein product [Didymodactylos carnosus]CAF3782835.1 unnamed protein product [Didymodactylos carnosus]